MDLLWQASHVARGQAVVLEGVGEREISSLLFSGGPLERETWAVIAGGLEIS